MMGSSFIEKEGQMKKLFLLFVVVVGCGAESVLPRVDAAIADIGADDSCIDECREGATICVPFDQLQYCEKINGCRRWGRVKACQSSKYCEDGICKLHCDIECPTGDCDDNCKSDHPDFICNQDGKCVLP